MLNEKAKRAIKNSHFSKAFSKPLYDSYCFSKIPDTIKALFGVEHQSSLPEDTFSQGPYNHVVFIFLDGFGWRFFEQFYDDIPLLKRGLTSPLTSLFPSTTAAHVTCMHTGLLPSQSGIYEWFQHEPQLNAIIAPLLFTYARHKKEELPLQPRDLYPPKTLYDFLADQQIITYAIQPADIIGSVYSQTFLKKANAIGYKNLAEGFKALCEVEGDKTYRTFYFPDIDSIAHRKGTQAPELFEALSQVCLHIEEALKNLPPQTAVIISADHGLIDISPQNTYYINQHIPQIEKYLQFGQDQRPLAPAGSCRDFFLHVREERREELKEILEEFLKARAEIYFTSELIDQGLFGPLPLSKKFQDRVGNLAILPYSREAIWWFEKGHFQQNFYAAHGGLSPEEVEIPFIFIEV